MSNDTYLEYLQKRSTLALLYRKYYLYPTLDRLIKGTTVDIGCGIGDFISFRKENTVGADTNKAIVNWCIDKGLPVTQIEDNSVPFPDNHFDSAILDNVIEHISNPGPTLNEVSRILANEGYLLIGVPGKLGYASDPDHKVFYDKKSLNTLLNNYGYKAIKWIHMPLYFPGISSLMRQYCLYGLFRKREGARP